MIPHQSTQLLKWIWRWPAWGGTLLSRIAPTRISPIVGRRLRPIRRRNNRTVGQHEWIAEPAALSWRRPSALLRRDGYIFCGIPDKFELAIIFRFFKPHN